jgi:uncharacterized membrane protein YbhN (UPF0104 family)
VVLVRVVKSVWVIAVAVLVVIAARHLDSTSLRAGLLAANVWWLLLAVFAHMTIQLLGALQWRALLAATVPVSWGRLVSRFALASVANNTTNSIVGHATGVALVAAEPGVGTNGALSLLVLDQLCVGVAKIGILALAASLAPLPVWMERGLWGIVAVVAALSLGLLVIRRWPALMTKRMLIMVPPRRLLAGMLCALAIRVAEAGGIAAVQTSFGIAGTGTSIAYVLAATALASLVPVVPANIGTYEAAVFIALRQAGVEPELAVLVGVVQHACQLLAATAPGAVLLLMLKRRTA